MSMSIGGALKILLPNAVPFVDYVLQDDSDGGGAYIAQWNLVAQQPTQADLLTASTLYETGEKWEAIKVERDHRKAGGVLVNGKWFHSDSDSRIQYLGLKDRARDLLGTGGAMADNITILGHPVKWKTMDGSMVDVTAQVAYDIVTAVGDLDAQLFLIAETHKSTMETSLDPTSYDYSTGWPQSFG